jgi:hypothetical protein
MRTIYLASNATSGLWSSHPRTNQVLLQRCRRQCWKVERKPMQHARQRRDDCGTWDFQVLLRRRPRSFPVRQADGASWEEQFSQGIGAMAKL